MLTALSERSPAEEFVEAHRVRASKEDLAYARFRAKLLASEPRASPQPDWSAVIWSVAGCAVAAFVCFVAIF
jgi:hypothetical protein